MHKVQQLCQFTHSQGLSPRAAPEQSASHTCHTCGVTAPAAARPAGAASGFKARWVFFLLSLWMWPGSSYFPRGTPVVQREEDCPLPAP